MERLWDKVKGEVSNAIWQTLDAIEEPMTEVLRPFWQSTERVLSFLGDNWLTQAVATFVDQLHQRNRPILN